MSKGSPVHKTGLLIAPRLTYHLFRQIVYKERQVFFIVGKRHGVEVWLACCLFVWAGWFSYGLFLLGPHQLLELELHRKHGEIFMSFASLCASL